MARVAARSGAEYGGATSGDPAPVALKIATCCAGRGPWRVVLLRRQSRQPSSDTEKTIRVLAALRLQVAGQPGQGRVGHVETREVDVVQFEA